MEGRVYFGSQCEGSMHGGGEFMKAEVWGYGSHYICSLEAGKEINAGT